MANIFDNLELITTVNPTLQETNGKQVQQFLYASQLYGTTFAIYGRFIHDQMKDGDNECTIRALDFLFLNYRGLINLGFTKDPVIYSTEMKNGKLEPVITFKVQAMNTLRTQRVEFSEPIKIIKGERTRLTFKRILIPMPGFENAAERQDRDIVYDMSDAQLNGNYFETEFMGRSGTEYYYNPLVPGLENSTMKDGDDSKKIMPEIVSPRCHQSNVDLYF